MEIEYEPFSAQVLSIFRGVMAATYFSNWEREACKRERVCVCVWKLSFKTLTSRTPARRALGTGSCPHTGTVRGCSRRSVFQYTDAPLFHIR